MTKRLLWFVILGLVAGSARAQGDSGMDLGEIQALARNGRAFEARALLETKLDELPALLARGVTPQVGQLRRVAQTLGARAVLTPVDAYLDAERERTISQLVDLPPAEQTARLAAERSRFVAAGLTLETSKYIEQLVTIAKKSISSFPWRPDLDADARAATLLSLLAGPSEPAVRGCRGLCHLQRGALREALGELTAASASNRDPLFLLGMARALWRSGDRARPRNLLEEALRQAPTREAARMLAQVLRYEQRQGGGADAEQVAARHAAATAAAPLRAFLAETAIARKDLSGALAACRNLSSWDREGLDGGLARLARREAAATGPAVRDLIERQAEILSPALARLAGDLAAAAGHAGPALVHHATGLLGGEREAARVIATLDSRMRAGGAKTIRGQVVSLLNAASAARPVVWQDTPAEPLPPSRAGLALSEVNRAREDPDVVNQAVWTMLGAASSAATAPDLAVAGKQLEASLSPARRSLIRSFVLGDSQGAREALDVIGLAAFRVEGYARTEGVWPGEVPVPVGQPGYRGLKFCQVTQAQEALVGAGPVATAAQMSAVLQVVVRPTHWPSLHLDPVAIDLDRNNQVDMTGEWEQEAAVSFDLLGLGEKRRYPWLQSGHDGWLCQDLDHNGRIDSGLELFGTAGGFADGFDKLEQLDKDQDGVLNASELGLLSIWRDANGNGRTDPGELTSAAAQGLTSLTVPRVGLRTSCVIRGVSHLCAQVGPAALAGMSGGVPDAL